MEFVNFSEASLELMHNAARDALADDDSRQPGDKKYLVRELPDWKNWSDQLEDALERKGVHYDPIEWVQSD